MKISFCLIVKNEAEGIKRCLDSIIPFADEIVVVDTGSTDETMEILKTYSFMLNQADTPRDCVFGLYQHEWNGSFADMRNISLLYATCDYIFIIDGDEELINFEMPDGSADAYSIDIMNVMKNSINKCQSIRLFKNDSSIYFSGRRQSTVDLSVKNKIVKQNSSKINHYGYIMTDEQWKIKLEKGLQDYLKMKIDTPNFPTLNFYIGGSYHSLARFYKGSDTFYQYHLMAIGFLNLSLSDEVNNLFKANACNSIAMSYNEIGYGELAMENCLLSLEYEPEQVHARLLMSELFKINGFEEKYKNQQQQIKKIKSKLPCDIDADLFYEVNKGE